MKTTLGEHLVFRNGKKSPERTLSGHHLVYGANGVIGRSDESNTDQESIVIGRVGSYCGSVNFAAPGSWVTENSIIASARDRGLSRFFYYVLSSVDLRSHSHGSGQPLLNHEILSSLELNIPEPRVQRSIGEVLGALDDKIAANWRVIDAGDSLVRVLYSSTPKTPHGRTFDDVADIGGGGTPSTKNPAYWDGGVDWATPTDVTGADGPWIARTTRTISEEGLRNCSSPLYPEGSILMTSRATIGAVVVARKPMAVNQGFIVLNAVEREMQWWLESQVRARTAEFETWANGATFLEISRGTFKKLAVLDCSPEDLDRFNRAAQAVRERQWASQTENDTLVRARDELLPLLMNGRITIKDAERVVGDVV